MSTKAFVTAPKTPLAPIRALGAVCARNYLSRLSLSTSLGSANYLKYLSDFLSWQESATSSRHAWSASDRGGVCRENRSGGFPAQNGLILSDLHLNLRPA